MVTEFDHNITFSSILHVRLNCLTVCPNSTDVVLPTLNGSGDFRQRTVNFPALYLSISKADAKNISFTNAVGGDIMI